MSGRWWVRSLAGCSGSYTPRDRHNVRSRVLATSIKRANTKLAEQGKPPIQEGVTNHSLRRTFASLLYGAGATPAYVMSQMGHTSASMALEVYTKILAREPETGARMDALLRGEVTAQIGTNDAESTSMMLSADNDRERQTA